MKERHKAVILLYTHIEPFDIGETRSLLHITGIALVVFGELLTNVHGV